MIILLLFSLLGICLLINEIKNVRPCESPLLAVCAIIIYVYCFSLINLLSFGAWSIAVLGISALLYVIYAKRKNLKSYLKSLAEPGFVFFIVLIPILYFVCKPIVTGAWDEYSHWALVVRNMLLMGSLPKSGGAVTYLAYPPATAIFQYIFMKISNGSEGMMYYAQSIFLVSCISILLKGLSLKKPLYLLMAILLPLLVIIKFSVHNIFNIFTDTIMAVVAISAFASYYSSKRDFSDIIKIMPILFVLCLIRANAFIFAFFVIILIIIDQIQKHDIKNKKLLMQLLSLILIPFISYGSWYFHMKISGIEGVGISFSQFDTARFLIMIDNFKRALFFTGLGTFFAPLTLISTTVAFFVMALGIIIAMHFILGKNKKLCKNFNAFGFGFIFCFILYCISLILSYQYIFTHVEGKQVASFARYMGTFFMFWVTGMFYMMITTIKNEDLLRMRKNIIAVLCMAMILVVGGLTHPSMLNFIGTRRLENVYEQEAVNCAKEIQSATGDDSKVYMIFQKSRGYTFMGTRYQLGTNLTNLGTWSLGKPYSDTDTWTVDISPQDILKRIIDLNYEYVYVGGSDAQLWANYGMLFNLPKSEYKIFKVTPDGEYPLTAVK